MHSRACCQSPLRPTRPLSRASSASDTRMALAIRTCCSAPRLHAAYTVAVLTRSRSATSATVNHRSTARGTTGRSVAARSTGAANGELNPANPCDGWTRPSAPTRTLSTRCEALLLPTNRTLLAQEP
jgi:hypothetical protein